MTNGINVLSNIEIDNKILVVLVYKSSRKGLQDNELEIFIKFQNFLKSTLNTRNMRIFLMKDKRILQTLIRFDKVYTTIGIDKTLKKELENLYGELSIFKL